MYEVSMREGFLPLDSYSFQQTVFTPIHRTHNFVEPRIGVILRVIGFLG